METREEALFIKHKSMTVVISHDVKVFDRGHQRSIRPDEFLSRLLEAHHVIESLIEFFRNFTVVQFFLVERID